MHTKSECCILNTGNAAWLFEPYAVRLAEALDIEVSSEPRPYNYVLGLDEACAEEIFTTRNTFVSLQSIRLAADKRLLTESFVVHKVQTPETYLLEREEVQDFVARRTDTEWCLKYPISCGASGHRVLWSEKDIPNDWPTPCVVQEFIRLDNPKVFRAYGFRGKLIGWNVRSFPEGKFKSPWVAHARGARYSCFKEIPTVAGEIALTALQATGLVDSYGCVDLIQRSTGEWLVLEVGTDGIFTHVDCYLENEAAESALFNNIRDAFWSWQRSL